MSKERINLGKKGEELVAHWLEKAGFLICEKNYKTKYGEIDLIARKDELYTFIEVKLRNNPLFSLSDLIVKSKQNKIIRTAMHYKSTHYLSDVILRFDVALLEREGNDYSINYIESAFTASGPEYF